MSKSHRENPFVPESVRRYKKMLHSNENQCFEACEYIEIIEYYLERLLVNRAESVLISARKVHGDKFLFDLKEAQILIEKKQYQKAEDLLNILLPKIPKNAELYFLFGYLQVEKKQYKLSEMYFERYLEYTEKEELDAAYSAMGFVYVQTEQYEIAIKYLQKANYLNPQCKYVIYDMAYCFGKLGKYSRSIKYYEKYLYDQPFSANVWYNLGITCNSAKRYKKAVEAFDFALALNPKFIDAAMNKGTLELNMGKNAKAISSFKAYLKYDPNSSEAYAGLGDAHRAMSDYDQAREYYRKALKINKYNTHALHGMALVYYEKEQNFEGLNFVLRALHKDKNNPNYNFLAALFFDRLGYVDKAEQKFILALEANPLDENIWIAFADLFVEEQSSKTLEILEQAVELLPSAPLIKFRLSEIYFKLRKINQTVQNLSEAVKEKPEHLETFLVENPDMACDQRLKKLIATLI